MQQICSYLEQNNGNQKRCAVLVALTVLVALMWGAVRSAKRTAQCATSASISFSISISISISIFISISISGALRKNETYSSEKEGPDPPREPSGK